MLALGVVAVIAPVVLGAVVLVGTHGTDLRLSDAGQTGYRLSSGQVDDLLTADLIRLQQDETTLFQSQVDYGQLAHRDPRADQRQIEVDLATASGRADGSSRERTDLTTIADELPVYMDLGATALADNQQGLPVGTAYLREASSYLRQQMLPKAADVRGIEQSRLRADIGQAAGFPWWRVLVFVTALGCLLFAHEQLARRTHRRLNAGLLVAGAVVLALGAGAITTTLLSRHQVVTDLRSRANSAVGLTKVRDDIDRVDLDDELTASDHDEDCQTTPTAPFIVSCANESDALAVLGERGPLATDLAEVRPLLPAGVRTDRERWLTAELVLPTLENLSKQAAASTSKSTQHPPRYDDGFVNRSLGPYTDAATTPSTEKLFVSLRAPVLDASRHEWSRYAAGVRDARAGLDVLAWVGLALGLAAGLAAGLGRRPRVTEYWSRGERAA